MRQVLQELGAKHEDFENYLQIYQEGTMEIHPACHNKFASIRNIYFTKRHNNDNVEDVFNSTAKILPHVPNRNSDPSFIALNGGLSYRPYGKVHDWMLFNTVFIALEKLVIHLLDPKSPNLPHESFDKNGFLIQNIFAKTVVSNKIGTSLVSPEGIHQDGNHVGLMMMGLHKNIAGGCGESRIFSNDAPSGPYGISGGKTNLTKSQSEDEVSTREKYILLNHTMKEPFEAIVVIDQNVKHEVRGGLVRIKKDQDGERGMHLMFGRRPVVDGWEKEYDGVSYKKAKEVFLQEGSLDNIFSKYHDDFSEYSRIYWEHLKRTKSFFPGQTLTFDE